MLMTATMLKPFRGNARSIFATAVYLAECFMAYLFLAESRIRKRRAAGHRAPEPDGL
jgi:hypothetical protein